MDDERYEAIRKRVTERYQNRAQFLGHLIAFLMVNVIAWALIPPWLMNGASDFFRSLIMGAMFLGSAGWLLGLVIHGMNYVLTEMRERAIDREIERERQWLEGRWDEEKPKRQRLERLISDDGELSLEEMDEPERQLKSR